MAQKLYLEPDPARGFAKDVYGASDALSNVRIDSVLHQGAGACGGTALVAGLRIHAEEQHGHVEQLSGDLDGHGDWIMGVIDALKRASEGLSATPSTPTNRDSWV